MSEREKTCSVRTTRCSLIPSPPHTAHLTPRTTRPVYLYLSIYLSIYLDLHLYLRIYIFIYQTVYLSLSIYLSMYIHMNISLARSLSLPHTHLQRADDEVLVLLDPLATAQHLPFRLYAFRRSGSTRSGSTLSG